MKSLDISPRWTEIACRELLAGVEEIDGPLAHNLRILDYQATTDLAATDDETAWCSAFVCFCLRAAFIKGTGKAAARSYVTWGHELAKPRIGAITVLWRGTRFGWQGHVGFLLGFHKDSLIMLGGNQGNQVSVQAFPMERLLGYRWPLDLDRYL